MATGNQVLPGAPATTAPIAAAGQAVTAEQAIQGGHAATAGQPMTSRATTPGSAMPAGLATPDSPPLPRLRHGAGGRWVVWLLRVLLWAVLLLIGYRGVAAIVAGSPAAPGTTTATTAPALPARPDHGFPVTLAQAYALEFGQVYLNVIPAAAAQRASGLAAFLPPGTEAQLIGTGTVAQTLQSEQVADVRVLTAHRAVVTLLARVNGNLIEFAVPIYAAQGGLVVSGLPAVLPAPARVMPPATAGFAPDPAVGRTLSLQLPAFFQAYASGSAAQMGQYTSSGTHLAGLGGAVTFGAISQLTVSASGGATRQVLVTVTWRAVIRPATASRPPATKTTSVKTVPAAPARIVSTYAMTVVRDGGIWRVQSIGVATTQPWSPS